jgi:hypothetical protein
MPDVACVKDEAPNREAPTDERLTLTSPDDLANALRFDGQRRTHRADEIMAEIVAKRLVEHLERSGFVVMKRPPEWLIDPESTDADKRPIDPRALLEWLVSLPEKFGQDAIFVMYSF